MAVFSMPSFIAMADGRADTVGHAATIAAGEWINDRTHGQQFKARFLRTSPPTSADGIEKYLSSGMIRGIGPAYAKKLLRMMTLPVGSGLCQRPEFCAGNNMPYTMAGKKACGCCVAAVRASPLERLAIADRCYLILKAHCRRN